MRGITFSDVKAEGSSPVSDVAVTAGTKVRSFRKIFLYVAPGAAPVTTLQIISPATAALYYTDRVTWQSAAADAQMLQAARSNVRIAACEDVGGYFGGVLALPNTACVLLGVTPQEGKPRQCGFRSASQPAKQVGDGLR